MLLQNIKKSEDTRLVKKVLDDQERNEEDGTFYDTTKKMLAEYKIDVKGIAERKKSELKKEIKERIGEKMREVIGKAGENMTKMRFIDKEKEFKRKSSVRKS